MTAIGNCCIIFILFLIYTNQQDLPTNRTVETLTSTDLFPTFNENKKQRVSLNRLSDKAFLDQCKPTAVLAQRLTSCVVKNSICESDCKILQSIALRLKETKPNILKRPLQRGEKKLIRDHGICTNPVEDQLITCDENSKYRTLDGSCNNVKRPNEGKAGSCQKRLFPNSYADKIQEPRKASDGQPLPEPRNISLIMTRAVCKPSDNSISNFVMLFGQFLDHDITLTPKSGNVYNRLLDCCAVQHPECMKMKINPDDPDFINSNCMNFVRSERCNSFTFVREQSNSKTVVVDCSHVYGSSKQQSDSLREKDGSGKMRVNRVPGVGDVPPNPAPITDGCNVLEEIQSPITGDPRSSQHILLLYLHTIFLRLHNLIVVKLFGFNENCSGEILFQEARRIVIGIMQKITYCDYLPVIIGPVLTKKYGFCQKETKYDAENPLTSYNEVMVACFRLGHSNIPDFFEANINGTTVKFELRNLFFKIEHLYNGNADAFLYGSARQNQDEFDSCMSKAVTKFLYSFTGNPSLLDLTSVNIQRGRDHGIPPYPEFVRRLNISNEPFNAFDDFKGKLMDEKDVENLKIAYRNVNDIDAFIGLISETPLPKAVVGPTTAECTAIQFNNLMMRDRFFYSHVNLPVSFTTEQRQAIQSITFSTIACAVTNLTEVPIDFFNTKSEILPCKDIPPLNLEPWRNSLPCS